MLIAHRGNIAGRSSRENALPYLLRAIEMGYGVEIDIRKASDCDKIIISHDPVPWNSNNDAYSILESLGNAFIALNIKESGLFPFLEKFYRQVTHGFNGFVFDFELCCNNPEYAISLYQRNGFPIARRYSDRGEFPNGDCDYIWLDEMNKTGSLDLNRSDIELSKVVYVSPELHNRDLKEARKENFFAICTDYCVNL